MIKLHTAVTLGIQSLSLGCDCIRVPQKLTAMSKQSSVFDLRLF